MTPLTIQQREAAKARIKCIEAEMVQLPMDHLKQPNGREHWQKLLRE